MGWFIQKASLKGHAGITFTRTRTVGAAADFERFSSMRPSAGDSSQTVEQHWSTPERGVRVIEYGRRAVSFEAFVVRLCPLCGAGGCVGDCVGCGCGDCVYAGSFRDDRPGGLTGSGSDGSSSSAGSTRGAKHGGSSTRDGSSAGAAGSAAGAAGRPGRVRRRRRRRRLDGGCGARRFLDRGWFVCWGGGFGGGFGGQGAGCSASAFCGDFGGGCRLVG